jgi:hypothetical protein
LLVKLRFAVLITVLGKLRAKIEGLWFYEKNLCKRLLWF